jgi:hypothetical protein
MNKIYLHVFFIAFTLMSSVSASDLHCEDAHFFKGIYRGEAGDDQDKSKIDTIFYCDKDGFLRGLYFKYFTDSTTPQQQNGLFSNFQLNQETLVLSGNAVRGHWGMDISFTFSPSRDQFIGTWSLEDGSGSWTGQLNP